MDCEYPLVKFKGITINNGQCQIYFCRHGESMANVGSWSGLDTPLSEFGVEQSKKLKGHFNLVLCSPLRRTLETLHYSKITYDRLTINPNLREMGQDISSTMVMENRSNIDDFVPETSDAFRRRVRIFHSELEKACQNHSKILIIGHGFFFNGWFRQGCYPAPPNAKIQCLL